MIDTKILDKLSDIQCDLEDIIDSIQNAKDDIEEDNDTPAGSLNLWKAKVLDSLPEGCSLKFMEDVEEFLDKFKGIY